MNERLSRVLDTQLTHWLPLPPWLRLGIARLPVHPPSLALCVALNRLLLPKLDVEQIAQMMQHAVEIEVMDVGLRTVVILQRSGFSVAPASSPVCVSIQASAQTYWRLLRGQEDADRLFFERSLRMEGDTEFGMILKNILDAIGPLFV